MSKPTRRAALGLLASLASVAATTAPHLVGAADPIKLRAAALPILDTAAFYVALDQGFFSAEGLDVTIAPEYTGTVGLSGAIAGGYDIVYTNIPSALSAIQQGIDLRFISMGNGMGPPDSTSLLVRKGENLHGPKDFAGKSIGVNGLKSLQWMVMRAWLKAGGMEPDQVTLRDVPFPQMLDALKTKQVDGIFAIEPFLSADLQDSTVDLAGKPFDVIPHVRPAAWVATGDYVQKNPQTVKLFYAGMVKGAAWINANVTSPTFVRIVSAYTKLPPARVASMKNPKAMADLDLGDLRRLAQLMRETGLLTSTADPAKNAYVAK
jgi:NitT/TauT family transport system substrate-binding protein